MNLASEARAALGAILLTVLVVVIGACQPRPSSSTATPAPASAGGGIATGSLEPLTTPGPMPSETLPDHASPVVLDPSLLEILPESVDGFPITEAPDEAAIAISDPTLPEIATALNAGVAVDTGGGNLVYAIVVKLRPLALTDERYRQWRDTFDEGACNAAGGVARHAEAPIDGRQVFITSCVAGMRTYHVWLVEPDILISASSIGDGRFGEKLMGSLRVPA